ncbi:MAG: hypothetical protein ACR2RL_00480 [Gammaproteobacteria bacterium]
MRRLQSVILSAALLLAGAGSVQAGMVVLDSADANDVGDNTNTAFRFEFSSNAPRFTGALLEFRDYEVLGIIVSNGSDFVQPLIQSAPGRNILFSFGAGSTDDYFVNVLAVGSGAFGLKIEAVPIPAAALLFASALGVTGLLARRRRRA